MRMPRVRFTVRGMMVAVAVVAVTIGAERRSSAFRAAAHYHATQVGCGLCPYDKGDPELEGWLRRRGYHVRMRQKYRLAMWLPVLPVAPDPPAPK
jgi:hypothetical protein